jgi:hypothetical protein
MFEFVFTSLLALHLLAVNIAAGAPLYALACEWPAAKGSPLARRAGMYLTLASLLMLLAGLVLGLALFAVRWSPEYGQVVARLHYKLGWGGAELVFSFVLLFVSAALWWSEQPAPAWKRSLRGFIAALNGTNLLYHFPFLFLVLARLADTQETAGEPLTAQTFRGLMLTEEIPAMATHVALASLAMAGIALLGLALRLDRQGETEDAKTIALWGARGALGASLAQIPVGLWILISLPAIEQSRLMNANLAGLSFLLALGAALWLMQQLALISAGETYRRALITAMGLSTAVVALMTFAWRWSQGG